VAKTLGFYANFSLERQRLSAALRCIRNNPEQTYASLAEGMGVNTPVAEGYFGWLRHTGLIVEISKRLKKTVYELTPFGLQASGHDPMLSDVGTQWLLHYYLATDHAERSDAWWVLANRFLRPGLTFTSAEFQTYFESLMGSEAMNQKALRKDPGCALNGYIREPALGRLCFLAKEGETFALGRFQPPHPLIAGYVLLDWWQRCFGQTNTVRFSQLVTEDGSLGRVFQFDAPTIRQMINALTGMGYLNFAESQFEPVNRLFTGAPSNLLKQYYEQR
jgi:predicted transcriptional regulator